MKRLAILCSVLSLVIVVGLALVSGPSIAVASEGTRTLYLIRHGQYDFHDPADPEVGKGLVPLGVAQARLVAARLKSLPVKMTALYSSRMTRARETALVIGRDFPELKLQQSPLLNECTPLTWRAYAVRDLDPEDMEACRQRLDKAFATFFVPSADGDKHDIIVCHGNVIRYFVTKVLGVDGKSWLGMSIANCSLTAVRVKPDGTMKLLYYGDVGHMPPNLQTGLDGIAKDLKVPAASESVN